MSETMPAAPYWSTASGAVLAGLDSRRTGLSSAQAATTLVTAGPNTLGTQRGTSAWRLLARQFVSPIVLILVAATILSGVLGDLTDAVIILAIILLSGLLSFFQERGAGRQMQRLLETVEARAAVLRDGNLHQVPFAQIVPGDLVEVSSGDLVPGDCLVLESHGLTVDESALTGETFPVEKRPGVVPADSQLPERSNSAFMGTHVAGGSGTLLVVRTGRATELGALSTDLTARQVPTGFETGMTRFGLLLTRAMVVLVIVIFVVNLLLHRPLLDSALFSLALAVGLTPQLLPAIVSISLAQGARAIASKRVIVRRLDAIEDFGSMNVLCSDKTGTMTVGTVVLEGATGLDGAASDEVRRLACLNAALQHGLKNPIDDAIMASCTLDASAKKLDELAYDFDRRLLSVLVTTGARGKGSELITKGAFDAVLAVCTTAAPASGKAVPIAQAASGLQKQFADLSAQGFRVLGVARRDLLATKVTLADESAMTFVGLLAFADPVKPDAASTLAQFAASGVSVRMLTGDNRLVAVHIAKTVGLSTAGALTGTDIDALSDEAITAAIQPVSVFSELNPLQKKRVIAAMRGAGNTVGYLGDGINDAPSLHAADVGISVNSAVAVAKESAAIVLLDKDLGVLLEGMRQGRRTFANTMKYIFMTTSANFGNMLSMAIASIALPFLPLLAGQILLINLLTDLPATTIATDEVDAVQLARPQRWNIRLIRNYMLVFGAISSVFDLTTFAVLRWVFHAHAVEFRSAWFLGSVLTEVAVLFVLRTRGPMFKSRPGRGVVVSSIAVALVTIAMPFSPLAGVLGLAPIPTVLLVLTLAITLAYVVTTELVKIVFWRRPRIGPRQARPVTAPV